MPDQSLTFNLAEAGKAVFHAVHAAADGVTVLRTRTRTGVTETVRGNYHVALPDSWTGHVEWDVAGIDHVIESFVAVAAAAATGGTVTVTVSSGGTPWRTPSVRLTGDGGSVTAPTGADRRRDVQGRRDVRGRHRQGRRVRRRDAAGQRRRGVSSYELAALALPISVDPATTSAYIDCVTPAGPDVGVRLVPGSTPSRTRTGSTTTPARS